MFDVRSRDSARVPSTPRRRPATSKAAKRTNAPVDRDLDPPLELYCWVGGRTPWPAHIPNSARVTVAGASAPRSSRTIVAPPSHPTSRTTGSRSGALERTRFAPSISRQRSGTVTIRRAARRGRFCIIHGRLGIPADVPALKFALQVWKAFVIRPFPKIGATRATHLRWPVQLPLCRCTP